MDTGSVNTSRQRCALDIGHTVSTKGTRILTAVATCWQALGQVSFATSLGDQDRRDVIVTGAVNSNTVWRVEWIEYDPPFESVPELSGFQPLFQTAPGTRILSCKNANLDGDSITDFVVLVANGTGTRIEHWEGDEFVVRFQRALFDGPAPPAVIFALAAGDFDGDEHPDILTIEDSTGAGPEVVRHYEASGAQWHHVQDFVGIWSPGDHLVALDLGTIGGNPSRDVILIRETNDSSIIEHRELTDGNLHLVAELAREPIETHRFRAVALVSNVSETSSLLLVDWYFYETVHQLQRWEFFQNRLRWTRVLSLRIPPAGSLIDVSNEPATRTPPCGDGSIAGSEQCDDGNIEDGDGCSSMCTVEPGAKCTGEPSVCIIGIPAASEWGLLAMTLLLLSAGTLVLKRHHGAQA